MSIDAAEGRVSFYTTSVYISRGTETGHDTNQPVQLLATIFSSNFQMKNPPFYSQDHFLATELFMIAQQSFVKFFK